MREQACEGETSSLRLTGRTFLRSTSSSRQSTRTLRERICGASDRLNSKSTNAPGCVETSFGIFMRTGGIRRTRVLSDRQGLHCPAGYAKADALENDSGAVEVSARSEFIATAMVVPRSRHLAAQVAAIGSRTFDAIARRRL